MKLVITFLFLCTTFGLAEDIHVVQVIDSSTNRGVPCVQLETVNHIRLLTDSNGIAVFDEPGLMNTKVFFTITSDGYEYPKDGFGYAGVAIDTTPNTKTVIRIHRINIAERLYRITGQGIYDQTVRAGKLAGVSIPISHPVLNGGVLGQDTVETIIYHGKIFWFWGDTEVAKYPLGNFRTTGATSELPGQGGLDPSVGVDLKYFTTADGLPRPMVAGLPPEGPVWIDGLMIVRDPSGVERLICKYVRIKSLVVRYATGLLEWDDKAEQFQPLIDFAKDERLAPECQPIRIHETDSDYFYFPSPYAILRVRADWKSIQNPHDYESFTCLQARTRYVDAKSAKLERDKAGHLIWSWKVDTGRIDQAAQKELLAAHKIQPNEAWFNLHDEKGHAVILAAGTVCWNDFLKKWILIAHESLGHPSRLGEVWLTTSGHPWGPFRKAVKIATHEVYTFYNVVQHPQFDQAGGRMVYFEGTYTNSFSYSDQTTPRYDYNQMMYRVDLSDPRLKWVEN